MEHTNDNITLQSKAAAELYCAENKAFLEEYDTDDKQINYYTALAMKLYDEFEIDGSFTYEGVRKNVAIWFENKREQMKLFRNHPYWDEEAKAIVFLQTETRAIDYRMAADALEKLSDYVLGHYYVDGNKWLISSIRSALYDTVDVGEEQSGLITDYFLERFTRHAYGRRMSDSIQKMLKCGTKITRLVRKAFEELELHAGGVVNATTLVDEGEDHRTRKSFDKYYARFADCLSELTVKKITVVSLNFLDFMTMSNGNSWSSCHFINSRGIFHEDSESPYRGAYKQGCLSYALDKPSFLLYTLPATFKDTDYYRCQKLTRMCCQYEDGVLVTGKCYPSNNDALITRYRQMMQLIISQVTEIPNLWTFSKKTRKIAAFVDTAENSAHYCDYLYDQQKPTISFVKGIDLDIDSSMTIGHEGYCLHCGEPLEGHVNDWLQCWDHRRTKVCACCDKRLKSDDECYEINGNYYCPDCVFYCEYHNRYEPKNSKFGTVRMKDGDKVVCCDATYSMTKCADCGIYYPNSEIYHGYCPSCFKNHDVCACCGKISKKNKFTEIGGKKYCKSCKSLIKNGLKLVPAEEYKVGDYVLMKDDITCCDFGYSGSMCTTYPGKVVYITDKIGDTFYVSVLEPFSYHSWRWSSNCFAGIIEGGTKQLVGKRFLDLTTTKEED